MSFEGELKAILSRVEGAQAVILMGFDGIPVSEAKADSTNLPLQEVSVECCQLLSEAMKVSQGNAMGGVNEFVLTSEKYALLMRVLNPSYFAALFLDAGGNIGKGRYALRRAAPLLLAQL